MSCLNRFLKAYLCIQYYSYLTKLNRIMLTSFIAENAKDERCIVEH